MKTLPVQINQSIISVLGRKLYSSEFAMVIPRELIQNALDAGASQIDVTLDESNLHLTVSDNGSGIQQIEGLLDTIGASIKNADLETIGGYGLAKLAIFGAKAWKFVSQAGSFSTGFVVDETETQPVGTTVSVEFLPSDLPWRFAMRVREYCATVDRACRFTFNGETLSPLLAQPVEIGGVSCTSTTPDTFSTTRGNIVVRVNGLPTFNRWINNLETTLFLDYHTNLTPYDEGYPLTSNRDNFLPGTPEMNDLTNKIQLITKTLEVDKKLAEKAKMDSTDITWRNKKYVAIGGLTVEDFDEYSRLITTWERYINQIGKIFFADMSGVSFGLMSSKTDAEAAFNASLQTFVINVSVGNTNKGMILGNAAHEFTHFLGYGTTGHDQMFGSMLTDVSAKIFSAIFSGDFRK